MTFSIIVPIYNVEKYLNKCIDSILSQTYTNFELILVDDGSPDNCPAICDEYAKKDSRIIVIHKENGGVSSARNAGIRQSIGDYILFIDGDDYFDRNLLKTCYLNLVQDPSLDIINFCLAYVNQEGNIDNAINLSVGEWSLKSDCEKFEYYKSVITPYGGWSMGIRCYKSSLIKENSIFFPEGFKYAEDFVFVSKSILKSQKIKHIDFIGYYYVQRKGSMCHSITHIPFKETSYMLYLVYDFALKEGYSCLIENYYTIFDIIMSVLVFENLNYGTLKQVIKDLDVYKLQGNKEYYRKVVKQYYKNRDCKKYKNLLKSKFVKRHYQDSLYKYAINQRRWEIYKATLKIKIELFFIKIQIKIKLFLKKGEK